MPIFDYRCVACGAVFEALVRGGATPPCPRCQAENPQRRVSAPAAPGRSGAIVQAARRQAAREGHFSHYSARERART
jgi:putative FmdB family regulatory protein